MKKHVISIGIIVMLTGCSFSEQSSDLKQWMEKEAKSMRGKIEDLPPAKTYTPVDFDVKKNPFVMREPVSLTKDGKDLFAPDKNRRKEALEAFQIETIKMTGFLLKDKSPVGIVRTRDGIMHYVSLGNYLGTNYGKVIEINENEIVVEERIQEEENWKIRTNRILLEEAPLSKK